MRIRTIWTLRGLTLRERLHRTKEASLLELAHRLPRRLAYWSFIDTGARYTHAHPDAVVPDIRFMDILEEKP